MEITLSLLPPFLLERLELFWAEVQSDFDCRFQESRERRLLEFKIVTGEDPSKGLLADAKKTYRWYDWEDLFEWNERLEEEKFFLLIGRYLKKIQSASKHPLASTVTERLNFLESEAKKSRLSSEPHGLELMLHRWRASLWREECRAIGEIIQREFDSAHTPAEQDL